MTVVLIVLLAAVLSLLCGRLQEWLRAALVERPRLIWIAPFLLTAVFAGASRIAHAYSLPLTLAVLAYTSAPVASAVLLPPAYDLLAVALLWLPIEFAAGAPLVPKPAQGFLHSVIYAVSILLGLTLFLGYRGLEGMKYSLPRRAADLRLPLAAFAITAPVLILIGIPIGFIPPPHLPTQGAAKMAAAAGLILVGTALPEEILFRALIQNLLMKRFGPGARTLFVASLIFGAAHLDNGPQPLPNWRYMILATIAGYAYGWVFQKSSSIFSSAALHMMVDWMKHFFF
ncbi:MAG TPA: type II CAAX endopeptidase family protein [Candidatus Sulfopaludibacter sp.]|nr:type II CAAX endopeptidase family protein [Candidatus Sulfopaludibacter sp.]